MCEIEKMGSKLITNVEKVSNGGGISCDKCSTYKFTSSMFKVVNERDKTCKCVNGIVPSDDEESSLYRNDG